MNQENKQIRQRPDSGLFSPQWHIDMVCNRDTRAIRTVLHVVYSYNKQLNSPWQHSIMPCLKTSAYPLVPNPLRGASLDLLPNLHSRAYKTYVVPGQGRRTYGTDRDVDWYLSLKFILLYRFKIHLWLCAPPGVKGESFAFCHMVYLCVFMWFPL
jgi:hypothetical protein